MKSVQAAGRRLGLQRQRRDDRFGHSRAFLLPRRCDHHPRLAHSRFGAAGLGRATGRRRHRRQGEGRSLRLLGRVETSSSPTRPATPRLSAVLLEDNRLWCPGSWMILPRWTPKTNTGEVGAQLPPTARVLLETRAFRYFAVQAGSRRPGAFVLDRSGDPRARIAPSSSRSRQVLERRAEQVHASQLLATTQGCSGASGSREPGSDGGGFGGASLGQVPGI